MTDQELMMRPGKCSACGADLTWIRTAENNKWMPCEKEFVAWTPEMGRVTLVTENGVVVTRPHDGIGGYKPHWAACPKANQFRKRK